MMERTLKNATSKLRNLKDLLSSTRNLSNVGNSSSSSGSAVPGPNSHRKTSSTSSSTGNRPNYSVSLFDLVDPPLCSSRPNSMAFSNNVSTSVSMYGLGPSNLSEPQSVPPNSSNSTSQAVLTSKNPALRLFYSIRSKLRRRKRGRDGGNGGKTVLDSKSSDFGPYLSMSGGKSLTSVHEISSYQSEKQRNLVSQSVNQLDCLDDPFDDPSFRSPLGCRDKDYEMDKENILLQHRHLPTPSFVLNEDISPGSNDDFSPAFPSTSRFFPSNLVPPTPPGSSIASHSPQSSCSSSGQPPSSEHGKLRGLTKELYDLLRFGWYWGALSKERAEEKLLDEPDGAFIVRDSSSSVHILSLSFNSQGKTKHSRIDYVDGKFCFLGSETEAFPSVSELIEYWMRNSEKGTFFYSKSSRPNSSYPLRLTKPISRFTEVKSLQFLSSFVLYQCTRLDLIPKLPLPPQLITYIGEQQYLA